MLGFFRKNCLFKAAAVLGMTGHPDNPLALVLILGIYSLYLLQTFNRKHAKSNFLWKTKKTRFSL